MVTPDDYVWIKLEPQHLEFCEKTAKRRRDNAVTYGLEPNVNAPVDYAEALELDLIGMPGECATYLYSKPAKWHAFKIGRDIRELPDLESWIEVRTRKKDWQDLIVRKDDDPHWAYVLALRHALPDICLVGWCYGKEARQYRFILDPDGRGEAYFVKQSDPILRPMRELLVELRRRQNHGPGFVGHDSLTGHFLHYCHCGKWGGFGRGVQRRDETSDGKWFCAEHRPKEQTNVYQRIA